MKVFAKFDEIPSMILEVIKETKRYGHTFGRTVVRSFGRSDNVKTVYPPTNTVCGGYNNFRIISKPHAYLQTMTKTSVKFQMNRHKTVGEDAHTRYIVL